MSQSQGKRPKSSKSRSRESINKALHDLNSRINQLGANLPKQPYLLSVPSDVPYRHGSRFVAPWYRGTPFQPDEEQLQHTSFLPHQDPDEELLRVEGGWWDEHGRLLEDEPSPRTTYNSGRNTPVESTQRKKISLKDYKTKDKMVSPAAERGEAALKKEEQDSSGLQRKQPQTAQTERSAEQPVQSSKPHTQQDPVSQKASSSGPFGLDGASSPRSPTAFNDNEVSPRPVKRRKLSPSPVTDAKRIPQKDNANAMPQLLSPTLPSAKTDALPELLSPLLPPTLVKAMATPPHSNGNEQTSSHHRSESVRSILANALGESSPHPSEKNGTATGSLGGTRVRSESQLSARSTGSVTTTNKPVAQVRSTNPGSKPGTPPLAAARSPGPRQRHIIALKYGKKNRKRVEALLKFAARPKKVPTKTIMDETDARALPKHEATPTESSKPKMKPDQNLEPPAKSRTAHSPLEHSKRPTTPVLNKAKEPSSPSISKSVYHTPRKELKSSAMRRVESTDGGTDPATPGDRGHVSTPLGSDRASMPPKPSPAPSSTPSVKEEDRQAWNKVNRKYFQLGRTIKHEGQALGDKDSSKSVALMIEALLCFMINLASQEHARPGVEPGWRTILPYHIFVFRVSRQFPLLHGLVVQLGGVCRQLIHNHDMDRLGRDPLPDDHLGSAPTPGSDGNTKTAEDGEKYKKKYLEFRDELVQNAKELQTAWLDGSRASSLEQVQREFPETWSHRSKDVRRRGLKKPTPSKMATGYYLPLDPASTAFEAAQYGLTVLGEWANNEEVDWRPQIELGVE